MHIIPERPPELRSAPPLDFRIVWIFWVDFCLYFDNCAYLCKKKKCWWTHKFTRLFSKRKKKSQCFFSDLPEFLLFLSHCSLRIANLLFLHLLCVAVRLNLMCVFIACTSVHTLWSIMSGSWVMYPFYCYPSLIIENMIPLCIQ